jgi:hypothetical protein
MSRSQGLKAFLTALCLSAVAMDAASAQAGADAATVPQTEVQDGSQPGWLLRGRGENRIVNPFRATPAPGTGRALQNRGLPRPGAASPGSQVPANVGATPPVPGCSIGFRRQGTACVAVQIPENGMLDLTGHGWMCNRGFLRQGQGCVAIVLPENASLDATGRRWACNYGFRRQEQGCIAIAVPEHAALDKAGHAWVCNQGYERRDQACIDDATARLQQQADKAVNARPGSAQAGQRPSVTINSGENRQGRTSTAKVVIGRF